MQNIGLIDVQKTLPIAPGLVEAADFAVENKRRTEYKTGFDVQVAEKARIEIMDRATELSDLTVGGACDKWLEQRSLYIRESTLACYKDYIARVKKHFEPFPDLLLKDVHVGHFVAYQKAMKAQYHAASVNHDLNVLAQVLKMAGLWSAIEEHYRPLPLPEKDAPKVMSEAEEERFFKFAYDHRADGWELAYSVASLTNNSTASGKELRMLQLRDIHMDADPPYFEVPKNMKTPERHRIIPMNEQAQVIMGRLLEEAKKRCSTRPEHYLFPWRRKRNDFEPTKPATESWLKSQWKKLVDAAMHTCRQCGQPQGECRCSKFHPILTFSLKPHNLRHQAITNLIDNGVPVEVVRKIAGHGVDSVLTWRDYHHGRMEVMARAMDRIGPAKKKPEADSGSHKGKGERA